MYKRLLALLLSALLVLPLCGFADVKAADEVLPAAQNLLSALKIMEGYEDGSFHVEKPVTRAEMAKMLIVALGYGDLSGKTSTSAFTDTASHWAQGYISLAADLGIITGRGSGVFDPNAGMTYAEASAMLLRTLGYGQGKELQGTAWKANVQTALASTQLLKDLAVSNTAALRGDIASSLYLTLFEAKVTPATKDGKRIYVPVTAADGSNVTPASNLGVKVVPVGTAQARFSVKGVQLETVYPFASGSVVPAPAAAPVTVTPPSTPAGDTGSLSSAQVFMLDPADFSKNVNGTYVFYAVEHGTVNAAFSRVVLDESYGAAFFGSSPKPGIYRAAHYVSDEITSMGAVCNPLTTGLSAFDATPAAPLRGIVFEQGIFRIGTNDPHVSDVQGAPAFIPYNTAAKAFCFTIASDGTVTSEIKTLADVTEDKDAYVWGTLTTQGGSSRLANLYIVHSESAAWNAQFTA